MLFRSRQCLAIEKRDGGPTRQEIIRLVHLPTLHTGTKLIEDQARGDHPVAQAYALLQACPPFPSRAGEHGSFELRRLIQLLPHMRLGPTGVLEVGLVLHGKRQWNAVCPPTWRKGVVQKAHTLAHAGINRTLARIQLAEGVGNPKAWLEQGAVGP